MSFFRSFVNWLTYGDFMPMTKLGQFYTEKVGQESFTMAMQLLKGKDKWALRLNLERKWAGSGDNTMLNLKYEQLTDISTPFKRLLNDVRSGVTEQTIALKQGIFQKAVIGATAGKIIRSYGLINPHPSNPKRDHVELFLSWAGSNYWVMLCGGGGAASASPEWSKWPVGMAEKLNELFPEIVDAMR